MAKKYTSGYDLTVDAFDVNGAKPIDTRMVVETYDDLLSRLTFGNTAYEGMIVYVNDSKELYVLKTKPTKPTTWSRDIVWEKIGNNVDASSIMVDPDGSDGSEEPMSIQDVIVNMSQTINNLTEPEAITDEEIAELFE